MLVRSHGELFSQSLWPETWNRRIPRALLGLILAAGLLISAPPPARAQDADAAQSLLGTWVWNRDSDGQTPVKGAVITMLLKPQGLVDFSAFRPGEEVEDHGRWSAAAATPGGGKISLELPEMGIKVEGKPYILKGDALTLPFTIINQVPGTSEWRRQEAKPVNPDDFIAVAYDVYERALEAGADDDSAAEAAAATLENQEFPEDIARAVGIDGFVQAKPLHGRSTAGMLFAAEASPLPPPARRKAKLAQVKLNKQKSGLAIRKEKHGRVYYILLKFKMPKLAEFKTQSAAGPIVPGFFANDPRTHLYMQPGPGRSDPPQHTAALFFPMNTQKNFRKGRYFVFKNLGEDPAVLRKQLLRGGYADAQIQVSVDAEASPKLIAEALAKNPGVFYISTHGMEIPMPDGGSGFVMASGTKVKQREGQSLEQALIQAVQALNLPTDLQETLSPVTLPTDRFDYDVFLGCANPFFEALRARGSWDMSQSLVYLDACESTANSGGQAGTSPPAVNLFKAKALLGWRTTSDPWVGVRYSQHFFRQAVRKAHTAREIWDHMARTIKTRKSMYQEDKDLDSADATERQKLAEEIEIFEGYGSDLKPYQRLTDVVHWLVWLGRWNQNPEKASGNLKSCYKDAWSKKKKGLGISPLCTAGYLGSHAPTAEEVKEARQLLNGLPEGAVGGCWTLADKIPYLHPVGTPYDK